MINYKNIVFGVTGAGKTNYIRHVIAQEKGTILLIDSLDEYGKYLVYPKNLAELKELLKQKGAKIGIVEYYFPADQFDLICEIVYEIGDIVFIIEEIDLYQSVNYIPKYLAWIIRFGRHKNIRFYATVRRPPDIHRLITSQASEFTIFNIQEPRDLQYFSQRLPPTFEIQNLTLLKNLHCISYDISNRKMNFKQFKFWA